MDGLPFLPDTTLPCKIHPSPNHGDRRGRAVDSIILHYTDMPTPEAALAVLSDPATEVSSHYLVDEDGGLFQLVPEARRAWHAGRAFWQGERDMNSVSIGIEIANRGLRGGLPPFPDRQIAAVVALCRDIVRRHGVPAARILAHSDIAPGRKVDPGPRFPWAKLGDEGLGEWPALPVTGPGVALALGATGSRVAALQQDLGNWGVDSPITGVFDKATRIAVAAFQLHFRAACVDGMADMQTVALLAQLVAGKQRTS